MRRMLPTLMATLVLLSLPRAAEAHHLPNSYCSSTGNICQSVRRVNCIRMLRISLAAKYFNRYTLCVKAPDGTRACHRFYIHDQGVTFGSTAPAGRQRTFRNKGPGVYADHWLSGDGSSRSEIGLSRSSRLVPSKPSSNRERVLRHRRWSPVTGGRLEARCGADDAQDDITEVWAQGFDDGLLVTRIPLTAFLVHSDADWMRSTVEKLRGADVKQTRGRSSGWLSGRISRGFTPSVVDLLATEEGVPMDGSPTTT